MKTFLSLAGSSVMVLALFAAAPAFAQDNGNLLGPPGGPFALVTHSENLPKQDVAAKFPQGWPMAYYAAARNGGIPGASTTSDGYSWKFAGARAWPLERKLYGYQAIGIKLAETTAAQWLGNTIGVSAVRGVILAESSDQFIYALNARTGQLVWRTSPVGSTYMGQPIVHGNLVYVNAGTVGFTYGNTRKYAKTGHAIRGQGVAYNGIYALNFKTGKLVWRHMTEGDLMPTPAYHDGRLFISSGGGTVAALDAKTGKVEWKNHVGGMGNMSSPAVYAGKVFVGMADPSHLYAFDEHTGKIVWKTSIQGATNTSMGDVSPAVADGVVVTDVIVEVPHSKVKTNAKGQKKTMRQRVAAFSAANGTLLWSHTTAAGVKPPSFKGGVPMIHDGTVYVGSPVVDTYAAYDLKTGKHEWTWHIPDPSEAGSGRGPAAWYQGALYMATGPSLYKVDPKTGKLLCEKKIGSRFGIVGPTIVDGTIYVGNSSDWIMAIPVSDLDHCGS